MPECPQFQSTLQSYLYMRCFEATQLAACNCIHGVGDRVTTFGSVIFMHLSDWFLVEAERGNDATGIDEARPGAFDPTASPGPRATASRCSSTAPSTSAGSTRRSPRSSPATGCTSPTGRATPTSGSTVPAPRSDAVLADLARRGVHVRGLLWRSHPRQAHFAEQENLDARPTRSTRRAARCSSTSGCAAAAAITRSSWSSATRARPDRRRRVRRRHRPRATAATTTPPPRRPAGGRARPRATATARRGTTSSSRCAAPRSATSRTRSASAGTTRRRSTTATRCGRCCAGSPRQPRLEPLPARGRRPDRHACGTARGAGAAHLPGEATAVPVRARRRAQHRPRLPQGAAAAPAALVYLEDQYLWSRDAAHALADALAPRSPSCTWSSSSCPATPTATGGSPGAASRIGRERGPSRRFDAAGGDRVAVYDLENDGRARPIYVHAKVCIVDDVWLAVGSDNLNRRSWTHDSEISCAVLDADARRARARRSRRASATAPGVLARETRLRLWREHLGRDDDDDDDLSTPSRASTRSHNPRPARRLAPRRPRGPDRPAISGPRRSPRGSLA